VLYRSSEDKMPAMHRVVENVSHTQSHAQCPFYCTFIHCKHTIQKGYEDVSIHIHMCKPLGEPYNTQCHFVKLSFLHLHKIFEDSVDWSAHLKIMTQ
jgi:hypothetical protein